MITQLQNQPHAKESRESSFVRAKAVEARVPTSEEDLQNIQQFHKMARLTEQQQAEVIAQLQNQLHDAKNGSESSPVRAKAVEERVPTVILEEFLQNIKQTR